MTVGAPDGNAQGLVWSVRFPSGDLVFHGVPRRHDERVRQDREVQQLSEVNAHTCLPQALRRMGPELYLRWIREFDGSRGYQGCQEAGTSGGELGV